ncbi:hypothetical protein RDWZM_004155 [Blomia tropicalis]|uniref:Innexin n=1 Tax=Blomia tropicalis TaxID=40697 RepID=A0A9Q0RTD0_BLOTA|nr:hypothetical protein RDWZM_004155 [Blomia tropicalis]
MSKSAFEAIFPYFGTKQTTDPTKPYYIQSFSYLNRNLYWLFLGYVAIIQCGKQFGISCINNKDELADFICLMEQSYTVNHAKLVASIDNEHILAPGVASMNQSLVTSYRHFTNFIWIDFVIVLQLILFQMPDLIWTKLRKGKQDSIFSTLDWNVADQDYMRERIERHKFEMSNIQINELEMENNGKRGNSLPYGHRFVCLSKLVKTFSSGKRGSFNFSLFGFRMIHFWYKSYYNSTKRFDNPGEKLFPTIVKCDFRTIGLAGDQQSEDRLCAIEANYILEKMLIFTWFYYVTFMLITFVALIYDHVYLMIPYFRRRYVRSMIRWELPSKLERFQSLTYESDLPSDFNIPYQVALFAVFLSRKIGHFRTRNVLKQFLIMNNLNDSVMNKDSDSTIYKSDESFLFDLKTRSRRQSTNESNLIQIERDNLYGHYLSYYRSILNYNLLFQK